VEQYVIPFLFGAVPALLWVWLTIYRLTWVDAGARPYVERDGEIVDSRWAATVEEAKRLNWETICFIPVYSGLAVAVVFTVIRVSIRAV
jgi:hypothetical protein